ncbi:hypothetical protein DFH06DRAFT_427415 [Mycena polygramma]|nr:hypothetical protein DFH06DRAFT_427415 [Mycena polygramma]
MSVQDLRARIVKLSTDIETHKTLLKQLEREKCLVQRRLNAALDPVARLPLEISSEIFLHCLPALPDPSARHAPMLLVNVCNAWADIAISTSALWATIHITFPVDERFRNVISIWLRRACNRPLSVSLRGKVNKDVAGTIWRHGLQLKHLNICCDGETRDVDDSGYSDDEDRIDIFGGSPGSLPLLKSFTICGLTSTDVRGGYSASQFLALFRLAPNLVECTIDHIFPMLDLQNVDEILVLPALRRLVFDQLDSNDDEILKCLSLPKLQTLSIPLSEIRPDNLLSFLQRSSPPLQELTVGFSEFAELADSLRLVPTLTSFEHWCHVDRVTELFVALTESPSLLPNLHRLILRLYTSTPPPLPHSTLNTLLAALWTRRTQLRVVHLDLQCGLETVLEPLAPYILASFSELMQDGMEVYIGPKSHNLVSA